MATYYIKNGGNDSLNGLSDANAWATITKINSQPLSPGDSVLFKRGNTWVLTSESFNIAYAGTSSDRIIYGCYDSGEKPIITGRQSISGWDSSSNWVSVGTYIWRYSGALGVDGYTWNDHQRGRIWFNGSEIKKHESLTTPNTTYLWTHSGYDLYVYSVGNPAIDYSNIEWTGPIISLVSITVDYITIQNLDFRGGSGAVLYMGGANHSIIENCNIGYDTAMNGYYSNIHTDDVTIRNNVFDTNDRFKDTNNTYGGYVWKNTEDALNIVKGGSNYDIYNNTFIDWGHSVLGMDQDEPNGAFKFTNVKFHHNFVTAPDVDYGRGFNYNMWSAGDNLGNEIYNNYFYNLPICNQISGDSLKVYNNIIDGVPGNSYYPALSFVGISLTPYTGGVASRDNQIYNNIIMNCRGYGIYLGYSANGNEQNNSIVNNILINNDALTNYQIFIDNEANQLDNTYKNNLLYKDGNTNVVYYGQDSAPYAKTIAQFNTLNGQHNNIIYNNIGVDPKFVGSSPYDYHLQSDSPAIGAGINVGLTTDYAGNLWNAIPSIGAYEYTLSLTEGTWLANRTALNAMYDHLYQLAGL